MPLLRPVSAAATVPAPIVRSRRALLVLALATASGACAFAAPADAATKTFTATEDARVEQASASLNYGDYMLKGAASPTVHTYIKFDVNGLDGPVTSAKLRIFPNTRSASGFQLRSAGSAWREGSIAWSNRPAAGGVIASSGRYSCCTSYVEVDATPLISANGAVTAVLTNAGSSVDEYRSREWGASYAPQLAVTTGDPSPPPAPPTDPPPTASPSGASRYVSMNGKDTNAGTQAAPWRTITKAATAAPAASTVVIMGGAYGENVVFSSSGTSAANPTTFVAYAGDTVSVRSLSFKASNLAVKGLTVSGASGHCVTIAPALGNLSLRNNTIRSCAKSGIGFTRSTTQAYTSDVTIADNAISGVGTSDSYANDLTIYGDRITVENNDLTGSPNDAINLWGDGHVYRHNVIHDISNSTGNHNDAFQTWTGLSDGAEGHPVTNLLIERNTIRNLVGPNSHCMMAEGPGHSGWTIRRNVFAGVGDQCMLFGKVGNGKSGITSVAISHNTFLSAGQNNTLEFNLTSTGVVSSNVFYRCVGWGGGAPYWVAASASVKRDYNLSGASSKLSEPNGQNVEPGFVNVDGGDLHLTATSPAVNGGDAGALIPMTAFLDHDGFAAQGRPDIGAYELR